MSDTGEDLDITDRIALDLPVEIRAAYYRELNYCRSLAENDEMLRILRAMQFLTLLMRQMPERVVVEREKLELLLTGAMERFSEAVERADAYRSLIEERLSGLPAEVAQGLHPESIAREINEQIRQQFVDSGLPQTAQAMIAVAAQLRGTVGEFSKAAALLSHSHRGAAEEARQAIAELEHAVSHAAGTARHAAQELTTAFQREFRWSLYALSSLGVVLGLALGMLCQRWIDGAPDIPAAVERTPAKVTQKSAH